MFISLGSTGVEGVDSGNKGGTASAKLWVKGVWIYGGKI